MDGLAKVIAATACGLGIASIWFPGVVLGIVFLALGALAVFGPRKE